MRCTLMYIQIRQIIPVLIRCSRLAMSNVIKKIQQTPPPPKKKKKKQPKSN